MHALKRIILLHLQTLANLNNYPIIMIDIIINSFINSLIIFLVIISIRLSRSSDVNQVFPPFLFSLPTLIGHVR